MSLYLSLKQNFKKNIYFFKFCTLCQKCVKNIFKVLENILKKIFLWLFLDENH